MEDKWIPITLINQSKAESNCRFLSVTQETVGKLKMIRPGVYLDDPRLRIVKDHPTPEPEPKISPERRAWLDGAYARYLAEQAAKATPAIQPQSTRPKTHEEKWRVNPALRAEFNNNLGAYLAYCKAVESGRCKVYGGVS